MDNKMNLIDKVSELYRDTNKEISKLSETLRMSEEKLAQEEKITVKEQSILIKEIELMQKEIEHKKSFAIGVSLSREILMEELF